MNFSEILDPIQQSDSLQNQVGKSASSSSPSCSVLSYKPKVGENNNPFPVESPSGIENIKNSSGKSCCEIKSPCSHYTSSTSSININNLNSSPSTQTSSSSSQSQLQSILSSSNNCTPSSSVSSGGGIHDNNNIEAKGDLISSYNTSHKQQFELLKQFESVTAPFQQSQTAEVASQLFLKGNYIPSNITSGFPTSNHQFCESSPGGTFTDAPGLFHHLTSSSSWKDQQHLTNCSRTSNSTNCNQINMSSSISCGVSSSSIFGGLCSGNTRRPSMFTAKYRMREERKKVKN